MTIADLPNQFDLGFAGLDSTARAMARAAAEHGLRIAVFDRHAENIKILRESSGISLRIAASMEEFMSLLGRFRTVVFSGFEMDAGLFGEVLENLQAGDLLIDAGEGHFQECVRQARHLSERNLRYLETGIIGGDNNGSGTVLMAGGPADAFGSVRPLLEMMASNGLGQPTISHQGPAGAAHFVKTIYDGVEYSLLQLVLETFDLLKRALDWDDDKVREVASAWQTGALNRFQRDDGARRICQTARELNVASPTIDAAVNMRILSGWEKQNDFATTPFRHPVGRFGDDTESVLDELQGALCAATMITVAQGMAVLAAGSKCYGFQVGQAELIRLWRICSGHRAALLHEITSAIQATPNLPNLLYDDDISERVMEQQEHLRHAVWRAELQRTPAPALAASLDYLDCDRGAWMPVNLSQPASLAGALQTT